MQDFEHGLLKHFNQALKQYDNLADRMNKCGHTLDLFACSLDQVGIAELHPAIHYTGLQCSLIGHPVCMSTSLTISESSAFFCHLFMFNLRSK